MKRSVLDVHIESFKRGINIFAGMLSKKNVKVLFQGDQCATDGKTIFLPNVDLLAKPNMTQEEVKKAEDFLGALRGFVDHEIGHVIFTDMAATNARLKDKPLLKEMSNVLEDPRVERKMAEGWRGAGFNVQNTANYVYDNFGTDPATIRPLQQVMLASIMQARKMTNHPLYKQIPVKSRRLAETKGAQTIIHNAKASESTDEVVDLAEEYLKLLKAEADEPSPPPPGGEGGEGEPNEDGEEGEKSGKNGNKGKSGNQGKQPKPKQPKKGKGKGKQEEEEDDEEGEGNGGQGEEEESKGEEEKAEEPSSGNSGGEQPEEPGNFEKELMKDLGDDSGEALDEVQDNRVIHDQFVKARPDEYDGYAIYTQTGDYIGPPPHADKPGVREDLKTQYNELLDEVGRSTLGVLQRALRNYLKAKSNTYTVRDLEQGKIDRRRLYRLPTGISKQIFSQQHEHLDLDNVVVSLWINASGSMCHAERLTQQVTLAFAETLAALNIPFEVCTHTTRNPYASDRIQDASAEDRKLYTRWGSLSVHVYKSFEEDWHVVRPRLMTYSAQENTYDGEAVMLAARRIMTRKEKRKVIFTLDDGLPEPNGGENVRKHREYLKNYVVPAVTASGVELIGVGMATESVKEYYPRAIVVRDLHNLGPVLLSELRRVLMPQKSHAANVA